ncbi:MAG TPA: biotin carboxylase, partial [Amycolatopsis sp.]
MKTAFIVRETRGHWIRDFAQAVRDAGLRPELVTEPLDDAERAELASVVEGFVVVDDVRDAPAVADALRDRAPAAVLTG